MQETYGQQFAAIYDDVFPPDPDLVGLLTQSQPTTALELGVGTGRIAVPLAHAGVAVTGVDLSPEMLERCRRGAQDAVVDVELIQGSMTDVRLERRFDLVFSVCASLSMLLSRDEQRATFATAREHLADDGRLVVETHNPEVVLGLHEGRRRASWFVPYPGRGRGLQTYSMLDEEAGLWQVSHLWHDCGRTIIGTETSLLTPVDVLTDMAAEVGLDVRSVTGDRAGGPVTAESPTYTIEFEVAR
ncbi:MULTISPECIES: class I SAM-dependent methyltransferase [Curtobacterium]|jgi:SAM-dependent methyltransferase|uniref:class I SAM-dependent methyltransferase n=2 Tax=Microbacteriaceae TaxID=85023 RepID=UPI000DA8EFF8|nr:MULTISPECIES: class I SAM-dependent methyltransferase [Curtobacterium]MBO9049296.1 class I SAM-dependent methyltransferase [Curtobacterium flaccumfaciens pv. flaccumfaciens]WIE58284.1 class I SAM-dependent methyltransferase [Curtobacterium sp. MCLR17_031]